MLGYQSTSFHDAQYVRQALGLRPAPEFEAWLVEMNVIDGASHLLPIDSRHRLLGAIGADDKVFGAQPPPGSRAK
jgi:ethanolamine ammonia-lyase large subunit